MAAMPLMWPRFSATRMTAIGAINTIAGAEKTGVEKFGRPIQAAPGHHLVTGDLNIPANAPIPRHYHHGEEFLYILGGSTVIVREGLGEMTLMPGQGVRIAPGTVHWGRAGPQGLRAVSSWVVPDGQPLRVAVPDQPGGAH